jgi:hypothetical protein
MDDDDRSGAGGGDSGSGRRARPHIHAHDEFELDIDVETDLTRVASQRRPVADLFDDDSEITEEVTEIAAGAHGAQPDESASDDLPLPRASNEQVLPVFLPSDRPGNEPPPPPLPERDDAPAAGPPDLSSLLGPPPSAGDDAPPGDDLFEDVSGIHDLPPVHGRGFDSPSSPDIAPPPPEAEPQPRFAAGTTGGLPLDGTQFEQAPAPKNKKRGGQSDSALLRRGPMRMAGSQRVVRRWFQPSLRDVLLLLLLILLGAGVWIGWSFYQDYRKRAGWERFDQSREQLERTRSDAIKKRQPKKEQDVP